MIPFISQPSDRQIGEYTKELTLPWWCQWSYKGKYRALYVPLGYIYDGASIPRIAWTFLGITPSGLIDAAALAHDAPYRAEGGRKPEAWKGCRLVDINDIPVTISRPEADWVFQTFGIYAGIKPHRMAIAYTVVRAFGAKHWGGPSPMENK